MKEDKFYLAMAIIGVCAIGMTRNKPLVELNRTEVVIIAIGTLGLITLIAYTLLKVWERRINK